MISNGQTYSELPIGLRIQAYAYAKAHGYKGKQITQELKFRVVTDIHGKKSIHHSFGIVSQPTMVTKPVASVERPVDADVTFYHETVRGVKHKIYDAGRAKSTRPKQTNDCTVRAVAMAFDLYYDFTYNMFAAAGRKCAKGFNVRAWLEKNTTGGRTLLSYKVEKLSFPAEKGVSRMNVDRFIEQYNKGTYIIRIAKHVACVKNGVLYDTWTGYGEKCVYLAYKISKPNE